MKLILIQTQSLVFQDGSITLDVQTEKITVLSLPEPKQDGLGSVTDAKKPALEESEASPQVKQLLSYGGSPGGVMLQKEEKTEHPMDADYQRILAEIFRR